MGLSADIARTQAFLFTKACGPRHEGRFAGARATLRSWGDATDGARGDALSGDSRERETATSEFRPLRFGDGAVHAFGGLFGFSRAVRLLGRFSVRPAVGRAVAGGERRCVFVVLNLRGRGAADGWEPAG